MASSLTGTGNQAYTPARVDYLASYLQSQLPGLDHTLAVKWINAERGVNGNVLGVTYRSTSGQRLYTYSSQEAGIRAAASLVRSSGNYAGIRASLGQSYTAQAKALVASPWNVRNSAYYARLFGVSVSGGPSYVNPGLPAPKNIPAWGGIISFPEDHKITRADTVAILAALDKAGYFNDPIAVFGGSKAETFNALQGMIGKPWGDATFKAFQVDIGQRAEKAVPDFGGLLDAAGFAGDVGSFLFDVQNWQYLGAVIVGVPLALVGFYLLAGVQTGGQNA